MANQTKFVPAIVGFNPEDIRSELLEEVSILEDTPTHSPTPSEELKADVDKVIDQGINTGICENMVLMPDKGDKEVLGNLGICNEEINRNIML